MPVSPDGKWVVPHEGFDRGRAADSGANDGQAGGVLDFGSISRALFHWRWLIAGATIVGLVLGLIATMLITPMYRASVTIEVNPPTVQVTDSKNSPQTEAGGSFDLVATQVGLLKSRAMAERAARDLGLANNNDFVGSGGTAAERMQRDRRRRGGDQGQRAR